MTALPDQRSRVDANRRRQAVREASDLAAFVREVADFEIVDDLALPYHHMGATITDAVLQAGLRCETTVWPRVQHVMAIQEAATTTGFLTVLRERGGGSSTASSATVRPRSHPERHTSRLAPPLVTRQAARMRSPLPLHAAAQAVPAADSRVIGQEFVGPVNFSAP